MTLVTKIPWAAPGSCREAELNAFRLAFPQGWPGQSSNGAAPVRPGGPAVTTKPTPAIGKTKRAPSPRPRLRHFANLSGNAGAPAAVWKAVAEHEPAMANFLFPGNVTRQHLIERCHLIASLHWIWSPALGLDEAERNHVVGVALDVLAVLSRTEFEKAPSRRAQSRLWKERDDETAPAPMEWSELRGCALCWRWARRGGQNGFKIRSDASALMCDGGALCDEHRPANGPLAGSARRRDQWLKPLIVRGPQPGEPPHPRFSPDDLLDAGMSPRNAKWGSYLEEAFPLVVGKYPNVKEGLPEALHILSGLDRDSVEHLVDSIDWNRSWAGMQLLSLLIAAEGVLWQVSQKVRRHTRRRPSPTGLRASADGTPLNGQG